MKPGMLNIENNINEIAKYLEFKPIIIFHFRFAKGAREKYSFY
jgi:hypothetical protein